MPKFIDLEEIFIRKDKINTVAIVQNDRKKVQLDVDGCQQLYIISWPSEKSALDFYNDVRKQLEED